MLQAVGVSFDIQPASLDEDSLKLSLKAEGATAQALADTLAEMKALRISQKQPDAWVIGSDQVLTCDDEWFDKPEDIAGAERHLRRLSGKSHQLISSAVIVRNGQRLWGHTDHATLLMRPLSEAFIDQYLAVVGDAALKSVGAYQLEGLGAHLFARIDGNHFTILGLPLLQLLDYLRSNGMVPA